MNAEPETLQADEFEHIKEIASRHGTSIAIGLAVILIAVLAGIFTRNRAAATKRDALRLLSSARTVADLETIADRYSATPTAPLALLRLAKVHYDTGNFGLALQKYDSFASQYSDHPFAAAAELGKMHCLEAQGRYQEALQQFQDFVAREPEHFLMPQAVFGEARCLEGLWRLDDARILYETFIASHPESPWLDRVEDILASVNRKIERGDTAPDPTQLPVVGIPVAPQLPEFNF